MDRQNTWMIGDIDVNNIRIGSFDELLTYLFVLFCVKKRIVLEFALWSNSKTKEKGVFAIYEDSAKETINRYFVNTNFLDVTYESEKEAADKMFTYQDFYSILAGLPVEHFMEICPKLFDRLCELYYSRNRAVGFWQPVGLSKFVCSLLKENNCKSIYNPFSGLCSYSIFMEDDVYYRGQEMDFETFQIAQLRLDAYDKANSAVYNEDAVSKLEGHFDAVVATPPFGGYFVNESDGGKRRTYSDLFLSRSLESDASLYVGIVPASFLNNDQYKKLRKELVRKGCIEAIILLPSGLFSPNTAISTVLLVLRPQCDCNLVSFIDAGDCFDKVNHDIDFQRLLDFWHKKSADTACMIGTDEIEWLEYDLSFENFEIQRIEENSKIVDVVRMGDVARIDYGEKDTSAILSNLIQDSAFCENILRLSNSDDVNNRYNNTVGKEYLRFVGPHLVISEIDDKLFCYLHKGESAFSLSESSRYLALKLDQTKIDPLYLASFFFQNGVVRNKAFDLLHSPIRIINKSEAKLVSNTDEDDITKIDSNKSFFGRIGDKLLAYWNGLEKKADRITNGFVFLRLGISGKTEQTSYINSAIFQQRQRKLQEIQAERERWGIRETTSDIVHMLGRPFSKQQDIIGFIKRHQPSDAGYEEAVIALADVSNFIRRLVTSVGGDFSKYDYKKEDVVLSSFVKEYVRSWNNFAVKDFDLEVEDHIGDNTIVSIDKDTMMILFDAAMDNAWRHGFKKLKKDGNKVCITMSAKDWDGQLYVDMQIGNNGAIIEVGFNNEEFISKGRFSKETGRTGLGGNHIYQITKNHDGFLSVSGGGSWNFCIDILLPIKKHDEYLSFEPLSHKLFFV